MASYMETYDHQKLLGSGSFGTVFHAVRRSDGENVAIKVIERSNPASEKVEVEALKNIQHDDIVKYLQSYHNSEGKLCIVFEYADRGTLEHLILNGLIRNEERDIWRIMWRISGALDYLHSLKPNHILHRDLKPANILGFSLWTDKANSTEFKIQCKIADFGIAKLLPSDAQRQYYTSTIVGTPTYMAPEVLEVFQSYSFPADIWSFGAVMAFCCYKGHLFMLESTVLSWTAGRCPLPQNYSQDLKNLVTRMLDPNPRKRPNAKTIHNECEMNDRRQMSIY